MNVFYLDSDPSLCAQYHCDKHVIKMITEYCQMLSTAFWQCPTSEFNKNIYLSYNEKKKQFENRHSICYQQTHINHPCNIWVRSNIQHFNLLLRLTECLISEYRIRYKKYDNFKTASNLLNWIDLEHNRPDIDLKEWSNPPQCMPEQYKCDDIVQSYRNFYMGDKSKFARWTNREIPEWFI